MLLQHDDSTINIVLVLLLLLLLLLQVKIREGSPEGLCATSWSVVTDTVPVLVEIYTCFTLPRRVNDVCSINELPAVCGYVCVQRC